MRTIQGNSAWIWRTRSMPPSRSWTAPSVTSTARRWPRLSTSQTVHQDVALATIDFLGVVIAARPSRSHDLDGLAVDDAEGWAGLAPLKLAHRHEQGMVNRLQPAVVGQAAEPFVDRAARWRPVGQRTPGAARSQEMDDGIHDCAQSMFPGASHLAMLWQERFDYGPLLIGQMKSFFAPCPGIPTPHFWCPHCTSLLSRRGI